MPRKIVTVSLPNKSYKTLENLQKKENKTRSEIVRALIDKYDKQKAWEELFMLGEATAQKYGIETEEDVLKIVEN